MNSKHNQVSREELDQMKKHHRLSEYTPADVNELVNLVRKYVNPHTPSCLTCQNNLREAKDNMNTWYLLWKDEIEARLKKKVEMVQEEEKVKESEQNEVQKAKNEIKEYTKKKKKK